MRRIGQAEDSHLEKEMFIFTEGISERSQSRDDQKVCDRWLRLRCSDLRFVGLPGDEVPQQR